MNKTLTAEYEPFGEEWKKEVSKMPKAMIVEQWKQACLKRQAAEAANQFHPSTGMRQTDLAQIVGICKGSVEAWKLLGEEINPDGLIKNLIYISSLCEKYLQSESPSNDEDELWDRVAEEFDNEPLGIGLPSEARGENRIALLDELKSKYTIIPKQQP